MRLMNLIVPSVTKTRHVLCGCCRWSCLHRQPPPVPSEVDTEVADALRPTCHFVKPQLLSFYCEAARYVNATCSDPAYVPLPPDGSCPALPPEGRCLRIGVETAVREGEVHQLE